VPTRESPEGSADRRILRTAAWILLPLVILAAIVAAVVSGTSGGRGGTFLSIGFGRGGDTEVYRNQKVMRGYIQSSSGSQSPFELNMTEMESFQVDASARTVFRLGVSSNEWGFYNGQTLQPLSLNTPVVLRSDGRIENGGKIPLATEQGHIGGMPGTDLFVPSLPDRPVSPGDTWSSDYQRPFALPGGGTMEYKTSNKLVRFDSIGRDRAAVISTDARVPIDVTMSMAALRKISPALVDQIARNFSIPTNSKFKYAGVVTYRLTSTLDTTTSQLLKSDVTGQIQVRVTALGVSSPATFQIISSLRQVSKLIS
jgi:hypothetical protein